MPAIIILTALIHLQSTDRLIDELYIQLLSPPNACTILLPKSNNCRVYTPATHQPNNYAYTPTINQPTGRQALYLTTITTAASTILPPK